jgi:hypothetical protein
MAAQGPQMTLGGATQGDDVEAKGLAESRDGLGHGPRTRSASFCSAAWASALQFLTDLLRAVSNPADSSTTFFRRKEKNGDINKVTKRAKHTFGPDTLL